ncbi:MAG: hypothetical protein ACRDJC_18970 [Thermomicrobiales bacterium]
MPASPLLDDRFESVGTATLDTKRRIALGKVMQVLRRLFGEDSDDVRFDVSFNAAGQILLSPETSIPLHEAWLFKNEAALASVRRGIAQVKSGELEDLGSFAEFVEAEGVGAPEEDEEVGAREGL